MLRSQMLTLTRKGRFEVVGVHDDAKQCGIRGIRRVFYEVKISCPPEDLDENGFMIDQLDVAAAIQKKYHRMYRFISCELLALDVTALMKTLVPKAVHITTTIGTGDLAYITVEAH